MANNTDFRNEVGFLEDFFGEKLIVENKCFKKIDYVEIYHSYNLYNEIGDSRFSFLWEKYKFPEDALKLKGRLFNILTRNCKNGMYIYLNKFYDQLIDLNPEMKHYANRRLQYGQVLGMISKYNQFDIEYFCEEHPRKNWNSDRSHPTNVASLILYEHFKVRPSFIISPKTLQLIILNIDGLVKSSTSLGAQSV